jgi:hypothetical protein
VTFQQFRLLSPGISMLEVFATAGQPDHEIGQNHWMYERDDGYLVDVSFVQGVVVRIDETKRLAH